MPYFSGLVSKSKAPLLVRLSAFMLTFLLLTSPMVSVFAQETATDPVVTDQTPTADTKSPTEDTPSDTTEPSSGEETDSPSDADTGDVDESKEDASNAQSMSMLAPQTFSGGVNTQTNGEGIAQQVLPTTDERTGALVYNHPIEIPPGRNGLQPKLELTYNSQETDHKVAFGKGWDVSIPYIERMNKKGTNNLYSNNDYYSSLSGELVSINSTTYAPKVEDGAFLTYGYSSNTWTVKDKEGTVYTFGAQAASRQDDPNVSSNIYRWMLEEVRDTNDNYITYEYYKDGGQIYPDRITYTGNGSTDGIFEVLFTRESRSDIPVSGYSGFPVTTNYRISQIEASVNGTWVRKYDLGYTYQTRNNASLLTSITESGQDESANVIAKPATTFTYQTESGEGWTQDGSGNFTAPIDTQVGTYMLDVNGDGLTDIVQSYYNTSLTLIQGVYINSGTSLVYDNTWALPGYAFYNSIAATPDTGARMADVNGDGLPDILVPNVGTYLNTGSGWTLSGNWASFPDFSDKNKNYRIVDLNGDGLPDIISGRVYGCGFSVCVDSEVRINNGSDFITEPTAFSMPVSTGSSFFADVNADGLPDLIYSYYNGSFSNMVFINTGTSWLNDGSWLLPSTLMLSMYNNQNTGCRIFDANSDGYADIICAVASNPFVAYMNNGQGWTADTDWEPPLSFAYNNSSSSNPTQITELNLDGTADLYAGRAVIGGSIATHYYTNDNTKQVALLSGITYPAGGSATVLYKMTNAYQYGGNLASSMPIVIPTVYQVSIDDGNGNTDNTSYLYQNGSYYFNTALDRKFAGFGIIEKTDSSGSVTKTYFHQGNSTDSANGEYSDHIAKLGKPYRIENLDGNGNLYLLTINMWDRYNLGTGRDFVKLARKTILTYDGDSAHRDSAEEYTYDNTYGNLTQKISWGEVTASNDGSFTDIGTDQMTEDISYVANTTDYVVGLPYQDTVTDQGSSKVRETNYYYDNLSLGSAGAGNQTAVEKWTDNANYVTSQKVYDSTYGIVTSSVDERGKTTSYRYDSYSLYPVVAINPLLQDTAYAYNYASGKVKEVTDPNLLVYQTTYDGFGRVTEVKIPDPVAYTPVLKTTYEYTDTANAVSIKKTDYLDSSNSRETYQYFDGLHRLVQERVESETGDYNVKDVAYNLLNLVEHESLPYLGSGSSEASPTTTSALYISYTYDPMQRVITRTDAVGTTSNVYDDWKTIVTDAENNVKSYYSDAYGNLVQVDEVDGGSVYSTHYEWNLNHNLIKITDALSNVRNFTYDGLQRRLTAQDLHDYADTAFGTWVYYYDEMGNLLQSDDPNGITVYRTYDDLGRILDEDDMSVSGTEISYEYDTCTNGVGKLCHVVMTSGADTLYTYNADGNIETDEKTINGNTFTTTYTYDYQGNLVNILYPAGQEVRYTYNTAGLLDQVQYSESGSSFSDIVSNIDYSLHDKPRIIQYANGVTTTNTYDDMNLYRLMHKATINGSSVYLQKQDYVYDNVGNIEQIIDSSNTNGAKTVDYVYDDLYRLLSATATNTANSQDYTDTFEYDPIGNILVKNGVGYLYQGNILSYENPHAVTDINGSGITYDNNGNLLSDGTLSNTWNYKNQLTESSTPNGNLNFYYDHDGSRDWLHKGKADTYYPNKYFTVLPTGDTLRDVYAGDELVATIDGSGRGAAMHYVHTDHILGSNVISDLNGDQEQLFDYYPFGEVRLNEQATSFNEQKQFGGHYFDDDSGLNYLGARYYQGNVGRFISEDPSFLAIGDDKKIKDITKMNLKEILSDPKSLNSYSYARNNPIINIDPDGNWALKLSVGGTIPGYGVGGSIGLYIDKNGIDYSYAGSLAAGGEIGADVQVSTENLSHTPTTSTSAFVEGGAVYGGHISMELNKDLMSTNIQDVPKSAGIGLKLGLSAGVEVENRAPLWVWNKTGVQTNSDQKASVNNMSQKSTLILNASVGQSSYLQTGGNILIGQSKINNK